MDNKLLDLISTILTTGKDMTIATIRDDGFPQATTVSYVSDGKIIYFGCDPNSQKAR
ncbi:MAG: pyridoxamine 5'-phosphate oxidase family protein, partial [Hyphomicrobiales bacterium]|nr:pyridoxamine 5'-phosphate oxidase family protein [Hyphomicrobiales bacterium]